MTTKNSHKKRYLNQVVLAAMLTGLGVHANAADLSINGGSVTIGAKSSTVGANGLATRVTDVPKANYGIPDFTFAMTPSGLTDGALYKFKIGITLDDDNSASRIEVFIPSLALIATGTNVLNGGLENGTKIRVLVRDSANTVNVNKELNIPLDPPISVTANSFHLLMSKVITAINADNAIKTLLDTLDVENNFTYTIAIQETTGSGIKLGLNSGTFAAFPRIQTTCAANAASQANSVFLLGSNFLAANFSSAYAIQGQYSVLDVTAAVGAAPTAFTEDCAVADTGGGTTTPPPATNPDGQENTNTEIEGELGGETVSDATVDKLNDAVESGATLADNTASQINSLTTDQALNNLDTVSKSIELAGTATQKDGAIDTSKAADAIDSLAKTLGAVNGAKTLSATEAARVDTLVANTIGNASNLIAAGASSANILAVVNASVALLAQGATASGGVSANVVEQVKTLTSKAVTGVIKNLPASALVGADTSTPAGLKALMKANPSVLDVALAASANLPAGTSITIGSVSLTIEEILALNLVNVAVNVEVDRLQGGFNFQSATTGFTVTTDATTGNMTLTNGTEKYVAASPVSRLVPDSVPNGISYTANGSAVLVGNGVATELAPTAFDKAGFTTVVSNAGFQITYRSNGTISIALGNNERFSGAFAYDNLGAATTCGAISITAPTGNPASAGYAFVVDCANAPAQRVTPIADNAKFYATVANAGLNASTDRNTGIITINTVGSFKPSFFVTPLSAADTTYYNATKNTDGIAFRASDKNGDGKTDYEVLSADGVQILYGQ